MRCLVQSGSSFLVRWAWPRLCCTWGGRRAVLLVGWSGVVVVVLVVRVVSELGVLYIRAAFFTLELLSSVGRRTYTGGGGEHRRAPVHRLPDSWTTFALAIVSPLFGDLCFLPL